MKKIVLVLVLLVTVSTAFGQNKYHEKRNKHFVEAAAKEYALNVDQQKELMEYRETMIQQYADLKNDSDLSQDESKAKNQEISKEFNSKFSKLVGKPYAEIAPFLNKMREELKNL